MESRLREIDFFLSDTRTRIPFRFGVMTFTGAPLCVARVRLEAEDGREAEGFAADFLVPKWFDKDPAKSMATNMAELLESARAARQEWLGLEPADAFSQWWQVYQRRVSSTPEDAPDRLVRGYGVALIERAMLDASCRAAGLPFAQALQDDLFGLRPGRVHPLLEGWTARDELPPTLRRVRARHTVGLVDELRVSEVAPQDRVEDGLPQALEEDIPFYGLDCFKLKVGGDPAADQRRLLAIAEVIDEQVSGDWTCTLDGNEQYRDLDAFVGLLQGLKEHAAGRRLLEGLLLVEQPVPRADSFDPSCREGITRLGEFAPVILDEADHGTEAFPRALGLGYRGISVKNCKGVFRALINRAVCDHRADGAFQSGEDLSNLGLLSLQQDLVTSSVLGIEHVERNGHHYFRGLDHLPHSEVEAALRQHADLYAPFGDGAAVRIEDGWMATGSCVDAVGYGTAVPFEADARRSAEGWTPPPDEAASAG